MAPNPRIQSKKHVARLERERRQTRLIQYIAGGVVASVILILVYGYLDINYLQQRQPVVEVNDEKISTGEFQARVSLQRSQLINQYLYYQYQQSFGFDVTNQLEQIEFSLDNPTTVGQQALDALIEEVLIRQDAEKRGIEVSANELENYTRAQFRFYPDGSPTPTITPTIADFSYPTLTTDQLELVTATPSATAGPAPSPTPTVTQVPASPTPVGATPEATATPRPTATPYTLEAYQEDYATTLESVKEVGLTEEQYIAIVRTALLREKLFEIITADTPREEEQVWARHILVEDEETAIQVVDRLKNDEDFGSLATEFSQDPGSRDAGGDLGWFGMGRMVAEFEATAFDLEIGQISEPVESSFGWHIIQVLGRVTAPLDPFAYEAARQTAFSEFLAGLRESSDVKIYEYWVDRVPTSPGLDSIQQ
jgi:parvulin-like peptidyl-prolyl isomerase